MHTIKLNKKEFLHISNHIISRGGSFPCRVRGSSMKPFIQDCDIATIRPMATESLGFGDVILFESHNRLYLHRIVRKKKINDKIYFYTRGDAILGKAEKIDSVQVLGQVKSINRNGRNLAVSTFFYKLFILLWILLIPGRRFSLVLGRYYRGLKVRLTTVFIKQS
jgi:signal peptidase I